MNTNTGNAMISEAADQRIDDASALIS